MKLFKHTFVLWSKTDPPRLPKDFAAFAEGLEGRGYRVKVESLGREEIDADPDATEDIVEMLEEGG